MSKKKQDLIVHGEQLFYNHGFHAIGLKRVIKEANVALMTLYNHFDSKEDLILEVLKNREEKYFSMLKSHVRNSKIQSIYSLADAHIDWIRKHNKNGCMFLRAKEEFSYNDDHEIVQYVNEHKRSLLAFFEELDFNYSEAIQLVLLFEGATALSETLNVDDVEIAFIHSIKSMDLHMRGE
ncbi:TetR family transcriptional regulator [Salipaludibacillus neizhouensis]|uniref:TetR family transcriptional regulator n=1 Tax=Salipaludibacillus neizhouensis TaxID=885475 RepID=A0A3A9JW56_9BACI|nr:TetR/AcrR family transcriptional regulator [Salipaludibacillus neizhouensis]RKL64707.1 TetR family transcriptional regulator [Salipaludibacillus neizhouensis]